LLLKYVATVTWEAVKPLVIKAGEVAPPQANEVWLKILYTSLCIGIVKFLLIWSTHWFCLNFHC